MCPLFTMVLSIIVTMSIGACEYLCCVFWAIMPLWIAQMITGLVPCDNHCALVLFILGTPWSFVWVSTLCFCYAFVWSSSPCIFTALRNLVLIKKLLRIPASVSRISSYQRDTYDEAWWWQNGAKYRDILDENLLQSTQDLRLGR
jgi:hypothetical protein